MFRKGPTSSMSLADDNSSSGRSRSRSVEKQNLANIQLPSGQPGQPNTAAKPAEGAQHSADGNGAHPKFGTVPEAPKEAPANRESLEEMESFLTALKEKKE